MVKNERERALEEKIRELQSGNAKLKLELERDKTAAARYRHDFIRLQQSNKLLQVENNNLSTEVTLLREDNDVLGEEVKRAKDEKKT